MFPIDELFKAKEAIMAYPEASAILFVLGLGIGWTASWAFAHRELKLNRAIVAAVKEANVNAEAKNEILKHALPEGHNKRFRALGAILLAILGFGLIGTAVWWNRPQKRDVALQFVYSQLPYLQLVNQSDQLARDIYGKITLWSLDKLPENTSPIQIQGIGFNWLRAQDKSEPQYIWGGLANTGMLQPENRIFGFASITCADCQKSRMFYVSIVWEQGGWYAELSDEQAASILTQGPNRLTAKEISEFYAHFEPKIPAQNRIPIK